MYFETYSRDLSVKVVLKATVLKLNIELPKSEKDKNEKYLNIMFSLNDFSSISNDIKFEKIPDKGFEVDSLSLAIDNDLLKNLYLCLKKNVQTFSNIKIYNELLKIVEETKDSIGGK
ncbi:MAG: hypothetical protein ACRCTZ_08325 [Sarcina sp.]